MPEPEIHRHRPTSIQGVPCAERHPFPKLTGIPTKSAQPATITSSSAAGTELRRTLALYEEAIRQLALENDARRGGAAVVALPARTMPGPANATGT